MGTARTSPKIVRERRRKGIQARRGRMLRHFPKEKRNERAAEELARNVKMVAQKDLDWVDRALAQEVEPLGLTPPAPEPVGNRREAVIPIVIPKVRHPRPRAVKPPPSERKQATVRTVTADHTLTHRLHRRGYRVRGNRKSLEIARALLPADADPAAYTHADIEWILLSLHEWVHEGLEVSEIRNELEWLLWDRDGWHHITDEKHVA